MRRAVPDPEDFVALVEVHSDRVHAYLARRAGRAVADDLLAEVWLQAYRSRTRYDEGLGAPTPWLYGIARNVLRNHWRRHVVRPDRSPERDQEPWGDADERIDARRLTATLEHGLDQLNDDDREVLLLVAWEQLTPAEVAVALSIPQGTARSRLHRARNQLQAHLARYDHQHTEA